MLVVEDPVASGPVWVVLVVDDDTVVTTPVLVVPEAITGLRLTVIVLLESTVAGGNGGIRLGPFAITVEIMTPAEVSGSVTWVEVVLRTGEGVGEGVNASRYMPYRPTPRAGLNVVEALLL